MKNKLEIAKLQQEIRELWGDPSASTAAEAPRGTPGCEEGASKNGGICVGDLQPQSVHQPH